MMNTLKGKKVDLKRNTSPSSMSAGLSIKRAPIQKKVNYVCSFDSSNCFQKSCLKNLGSYNLRENSSFNSCSTIMTPKTLNLFTLGGYLVCYTMCSLSIKFQCTVKNLNKMGKGIQNSLTVLTHCAWDANITLHGKKL